MAAVHRRRYQVGARPTIYAICRERPSIDVATGALVRGALVSPTGISVVVEAPDGTVTKYELGSSAAVVNNNDGSFEFRFPAGLIDAGGTWQVGLYATIDSGDDQAVDVVEVPVDHPVVPLPAAVA